MCQDTVPTDILRSKIEHWYTKTMKKALYIFAFALFGLIVATIIHAVIELIALDTIFGQPDKYFNTFWWQEWHLIHWGVSYFLWFKGFVLGMYLGFRYWQPHGSKPGFHHWAGEKQSKSV